MIDRRIAFVEIDFRVLEQMLKAEYEDLLYKFKYKSDLPKDAVIIKIFPEEVDDYLFHKFKILIWSSEFEKVEEGCYPPLIYITQKQEVKI